MKKVCKCSILYFKLLKIKMHGELKYNKPKNARKYDEIFKQKVYDIGNLKRHCNFKEYNIYYT